MSAADRNARRRRERITTTSHPPNCREVYQRVGWGSQLGALIYCTVGRPSATPTRCSHCLKVVVPVRLQPGALQRVAIAEEGFEIGRGFGGFGSLGSFKPDTGGVSVELAFVSVVLMMHDTRGLNCPSLLLPFDWVLLHLLGSPLSERPIMIYPFILEFDSGPRHPPIRPLGPMLHPKLATVPTAHCPFVRTAAHIEC